MAWLSDLAGKAEYFLNNLDEQTGAALRHHRVARPNKFERYPHNPPQGPSISPPRTVSKRVALESATFSPPRHQSKPHPAHKPYPSGYNGRESFGPKKYHVNNFTKKLVDSDKTSGLRHIRRMSLPIDLEITASGKDTHKLDSLEKENVVLRNELHVLNHEISDLLETLRMTEDGNDVDSISKDLKNTMTKLKSIEQTDKNNEKEYLLSQIHELKQLVSKLINGEVKKHNKEYQNLLAENDLFKEKMKATEKEITELNRKLSEKEHTCMKLENELRHTHSIINELQNDIDRSNKECKRLEDDWEAYKVRVKGMLHAKDGEIKALREGLDINEDCKVLSKQVDDLKEERQELTDIIEKVHKENAEMKRYVELIESKNKGIDRTVTSLRDALKEEHAARTQIETQYSLLQKELQAVRIETGHTIAALRTSLRDKDIEINHLKSTMLKSSDTSALNVADYTRESQETIDNDKVQYLSQILCQRQERIDSLLADNNMMRIQMENLESKLKSATSNSSRVINLQDNDVRVRSRTNITESPISRFLLRIGIMMKRYPLVRLLMVFYMVGLHFCVISILLANTPDTYSTRPSKS